MDWVAKGFQPGFHELIFQRLGAVKAEKVLKTLSIAKIFSLVKLKSMVPFGRCYNFQTESYGGASKY